MLAGDDGQRQPGKGQDHAASSREYLRKTVINYRQQSQTQPEGKDPIYQKDDLPYTRPVFA